MSPFYLFLRLLLELAQCRGDRCTYTPLPLQVSHQQMRHHQRGNGNHDGSESPQSTIYIRVCWKASLYTEETALFAQEDAFQGLLRCLLYPYNKHPLLSCKASLTVVQGILTTLKYIYL